jgi:hypothetical protein
MSLLAPARRISHRRVRKTVKWELQNRKRRSVSDRMNWYMNMARTVVPEVCRLHSDHGEAQVLGAYARVVAYGRVTFRYDIIALSVSAVN